MRLSVFLYLSCFLVALSRLSAIGYRQESIERHMQLSGPCFGYFEIGATDGKDVITIELARQIARKESLDVCFDNGPSEPETQQPGRALSIASWERAGLF